MWSDGRRLAADAVLRVPFVLLGLAGVLWASAALPSFWQLLGGADVSARILVNDRFKPGVMADVLARLESQPSQTVSHPDFVRAEALVSLGVSKEAMERKGSDEANRDLQFADHKVRAAHALNPADSFLWLMLYWVDNERDGFDARNIRYLEQSYATATREGWIALRRNRLALTIFPMLSDTMQENVVSEFAGMVDSDFMEDAAVNLTTVGWPHRDRLLAGLERVDIIPRETFAKKLARDGVRVAVPDVEIDERLWRQ